MSPISDQELQRHLSRRSSKALPADDREDVLAAVGGARARPRWSFRMRPGLLLAPIAAIVLVVIVAVPLLWTLAPGPGPSPSPSAIKIYSTQELVSLAREPGFSGTVIARVTLDPPFPLPSELEPCPAPEVCDSQQSIGQYSTEIWTGWRDAPEGEGTQLPSGQWVTRVLAALLPAGALGAYRVSGGRVEYLGPAYLSPGGLSMTVEAAKASAPSDPADDVFVVSGWLGEAVPSGCPVPAVASCDGSYLTRDREFPRTTEGNNTSANYPVGPALHLQAGAYGDFAASTGSDEHGAIPSYGTYLVRPAGCPTLVTGSDACRWTMLGRLDETSTNPTPSPSPSSSSVTIHSSQQLSDMIGDPAWVGRVVLAQAQLGPADPSGPLVLCFVSPCQARLLAVSGNDYVAIGTRDTPGGGVRDPDGHYVQGLSVPTEPGIFAFKIHGATELGPYAEYLGPAVLHDDGTPWTAAEMAAKGLTDAADDVYVVSGWLAYSAPTNLNCPMPQDQITGDRHPDMSWYCGGSWLNPDDERASSTSFAMSGLHAQIDAYQNFAPQPAFDEQGAIPREGSYLVRSAGCPPDTMGDCPVFRMVGRLDESTINPSPSPSPTTEPTASVGPTAVLTQGQLIAMTNDPAAAGRVVIADAQFAPVPSASEADCNVPDPCYAGQIGVNPGVVVFSGWRDSAKDGTGTFYAPEGRWLDRLVPSSLQEQVMAFRIGHESVEYLGTVEGSGDSLVWSPDDVPTASAAPPDSIYAVSGWLVRTQPVACPLPGDLPADTDFGYFCGGSFITATANAIAQTQNDLDPGGVHVQAGAYDNFALNPASIAAADGGLASTSDRAVYLVRPVGERLWEANAWRLVDRLDPPMAGPGPSATQSPHATATAAAAQRLHIYTAQQMVDMAGVPELVGRYVLAQAQMEQPIRFGYPPCTVPDPCAGEWRLVGVSGYSGVSVGWRDTTPGEGTRYEGPNGTEWLELLTPPTSEGVYAFKILSKAVEYLGPARLASDGSAWTAADLLRLAPNGPTDDVYVVSGSLIRPNSPECPAPNDSDSKPDLSWFCGGSWITSSHSWPVDPLKVDGIHVQWIAYKDYAPTSFYDSNGGQQSDGTYLVRSVGCPADITGDCPVYRMVGRLNPVMVTAGPR